MNPPNNLLGVDVQIDRDNLPKPCCPRCGEEIPAYYAYIHKMSLPENAGVLLMQSYCCPRANCRAVIVCMPVGVEASDVVAPGKAGWPGLKM